MELPSGRYQEIGCPNPATDWSPAGPAANCPRDPWLHYQTNIFVCFLGQILMSSWLTLVNTPGLILLGQLSRVLDFYPTQLFYTNRQHLSIRVRNSHISGVLKSFWTPFDIFHSTGTFWWAQSLLMRWPCIFMFITWGLFFNQHTTMTAIPGHQVCQGHIHLQQRRIQICFTIWPSLTRSPL